MHLTMFNLPLEGALTGESRSMLQVSLDALRQTPPWAQNPLVARCEVSHLIAAAKQAAADNRAKARIEAERGAFKFAKLHEVASLTYDEDAEAMTASGVPIHRSVDHYVETESAYRRLAEKIREKCQPSLMRAVAG